MASRATLACYCAAFFVSAALVFSAQPMISKLVLPRYGGSSAVWTTCMLFFQAMLLAGYAYAHATSIWLGRRTQVVLHLVLIVASIVLLPIAVPADASPGATDSPTWSLLLLLAVCAGGPFFVATTTAPLLQRWFVYTGHRSSSDPYFLYAVSNAGSMAALLAYPLLLEPLLGLSQQTWSWAVVYGLLVALVAACAALTWRGSQPSDDKPHEKQKSTDTAARSSRREIGWWVLLAFVPSSWMLGVTARATTDIAPIPLLWVLPLAVYLLTFILVFARRQVVPHAWIVRAFPFVLITLIGSLIVSAVWQMLSLELFAFFVGAMVCHGELARRRPAVERLTAFYLWMAVGGVLGGVFNAIIAPLIFPVLLELPIAIALACVCCPAREKSANQRADLVLLVAAAIVIAVLVQNVDIVRKPTLVTLACLAIPALIVLCFARQQLAFAAVLGAVMIWDQFDAGHEVDVVYRARSFYGLHRVDWDAEPEETRNPAPRFRYLQHGTTQHGIQSLNPALACEPLAYYHRDGPLGDVFAEFPPNDRSQQVAVIGLGTGATVCYAVEHRHFIFYEIDRVVESIADNYFTYLSQCGRDQYEVILGDGRVMIASANDAQFDIIMLDAFSSDAIPTHLLTREAIELYLQKLSQNGVLVFHISNQYLDLSKVLGDVADELGLAAFVCHDWYTDETELIEAVRNGKAESSYVVMAREFDQFGGLPKRPKWQTLEPQENPRPWTDDYSNILDVLR